MSERPAGWFRKIRERELHRGHVISLAEGTFEDPDGQPMTRDIVHHPGAVAVVAIHDGDVVLVRQYRAAIDRELLEIPAGKRDVDGESPQDSAIRELEEEVGLTADEVEPLATFYNSVGFSDEHSHVFLATEVREVPMARDGVEERWMTIERVPLDEVAAMIERGEIEDAKTMIGLMAALRRLGR